jgi:hypothetical protein
VSQFYFQSACAPCPSHGRCDGSARMDCETNYYKTDDGKGGSPSCQTCPEGGTCKDNEFTGKLPGSIWTKVPQTIDGKTTLVMRVAACPVGFALVRTLFNPAGDQCEECQPGTYNIEGSKWSGKDTARAICLKCPAEGADCPGGAVVLAEVGWFAFPERMKYRRSGSGTVANASVWRVYQCEQGACAGNNSCNGNRTGLLCGYCAPGYAMELDVCAKCSSNNNGVQSLKYVFIALGVLLVLLILFLIGWREVAPGNYLHLGYDKLLEALSEMLSQLVRFMSLKGKVSSASDEIGKILKDPTVQKLLAQAAKIAVAYFQVMRSFFNFKIKWPEMLRNALATLAQLSTLVSFDFIQWPGLSCMTKLPYQTKVYVSTSLPLLFAIAMWTPVLLLMCRLAWLPKECVTNEERKRKIDLKQRLRDTSTSFWNNLLTWLFLIFPPTVFMSLQSFGCQKIGGKNYLLADNDGTEPKACPTEGPWDAIAIWSLVASVFWGLGVPVFCYVALRFHNVPQMAKEKQSQGLVKSMVNIYMGNKTTSSKYSLAVTLGHPAHNSDGKDDEVEAQRRVRDTFKKIFPEWNENDSKWGGKLPAWVGAIMHELDKPKNMREFREQTRQWFDRIDIDLNGTIDGVEIRKEFERLKNGLRWKNVGFNKPGAGLEIHNKALSDALISGKIELNRQQLDSFNVSEMCCDSYIRVKNTYFKQDVDVKQIHDHADIFIKDFDADYNGTLDVDEFQASLIHSLDNTIPGFNAAEVVTLWSLFQEVDEGDGAMTFQEFVELSTKLTDGAFFFTGLENFDSLSAEQLSGLLKHPWQSRQKETDAEVDGIVNETEDDNERKKGYIAMLGLKDKAKTFTQETIEKQEQQAAEKTKTREAADISSKKLHQVTESQKKVFETVSIFCKEMCAILDLDSNQLAEPPADPFDATNLPHTMEILRLKVASHLKGLIKMHQTQDPKYKNSGSHIQLHEHTILLQNISSGMAWHGLMLELTRKTRLLRRTLAEQVEEVAWNLKRQGVLSLPALEWDGSLGTRERLAIDRMGFLLNAYQVSCWYWEMVELVRKLLLTGILVVVYQGSPPHLAGSLLTIFLFLCLHLTVDPYLNKGLNEFQRLILFSQFFTIFGGIMYHMVSCVDKMLEIEETLYKGQERDIVAALIIIINLVAIGVYPVYRIVAVTSGFKGSVLIFSLKDKVSNLWTRGKGDQGNKVEFQGHLADDSSTSQLFAEVRQLKATNGCLPMGAPRPTAFHTPESRPSMPADIVPGRTESARIGPPPMYHANAQIVYGQTLQILTQKLQAEVQRRQEREERLLQDVERAQDAEM